MNIEFVINDYLIAWYLLFRPSFCEEIQNLKEKLWNTYQKQYVALKVENIEILKYTKDFIPDDDTLYNLVFESEIFGTIKKETEKYRQNLLKTWDQNKKQIQEYFDNTIRIKNFETYTVLVVYPKMDIVEFIQSNPKKNIAWGKQEGEELLQNLIHIIYTITRYKVGDFQKENTEITSSILDLAIHNELYTRIVGSSKYGEGNRKLRLLRRQLYPYWLMYLGCDKEELVTYMMRDQIAFDIDKYTIEKELKKIDFYGFIDFCCKNQKYIIRLDNLTI